MSDDTSAESQREQARELWKHGSLGTEADDHAVVIACKKINPCLIMPHINA